MQKGFSTILVLIALVALVVVGGAYYFGVNKSKTSQPHPNPITSQQVTNTKAYTNSFYNIRLDLPLDWVVEESIRSNGQPAFKLSSANQETVIQNFPPSESQEYNHIQSDPNAPDMQPDQFYYYSKKAGLENPKTQVGQYTVGRSRFFNGEGGIYDSLSLYNIPNQKVMAFYFVVGGDFKKNNQQLLDILKTFSYTKPEPSITEYFTYTLPSGWKKQSEDTGLGSIVFSSSDYKVGEGAGYILQGVSMNVSRGIMPQNKTLQEVVNESPDKKTNDIQPVQIGGLTGLMRHGNWEGHYQIFYVVKDKFLWKLTAETVNLEDENKHRQEIDTFIASIKLK